jgi:broad specificity phosphatase PhoE
VLDRVRALGRSSVVLVGHGRINRVLMAVLMGRDVSRMDEILQRNAGLSVFDWNGGPAVPLLLDDVGHLPPDMVTTIGGDSVR